MPHKEEDEKIVANTSDYGVLPKEFQKGKITPLSLLKAFQHRIQTVAGDEGLPFSTWLANALFKPLRILTNYDYKMYATHDGPDQDLVVYERAKTPSLRQKVLASLAVLVATPLAYLVRLWSFTLNPPEALPYTSMITATAQLDDVVWKEQLANKAEQERLLEIEKKKAAKESRRLDHIDVLKKKLMDSAIAGNVDGINAALRSAKNISYELVDQPLGNTWSDVHYRTALMFAAEHGHYEAVRTLLHAGADASLQRIRVGYDALRYAAYMKVQEGEDEATAIIRRCDIIELILDDLNTNDMAASSLKNSRERREYIDLGPPQMGESHYRPSIVHQYDLPQATAIQLLAKFVSSINGKILLEHDGAKAALSKVVQRIIDLNQEHGILNEHRAENVLCRALDITRLTPLTIAYDAAKGTDAAVGSDELDSVRNTGVLRSTAR